MYVAFEVKQTKLQKVIKMGNKNIFQLLRIRESPNETVDLFLHSDNIFCVQKSAWNREFKNLLGVNSIIKFEYQLL